MGNHIVEALLKTGKHKVTAITRADSTSKVPASVQVKKVNYDDQASLVEALQGQDALVITMGARAPEDQQTKLIEAAAAANVSWVMPNEYGCTGSPAIFLLFQSLSGVARHVSRGFASLALSHYSESVLKK